MKSTPLGSLCDTSKFFIRVGVAVTFISIGLTVQAQVLLLLKNGSFETPVNTTGILTPSDPDYWSVTSGLGAVIINTALHPWAQYLPATDGSQVAMLYATTISQNVSLVSGGQYLLTFDLSPRQYDGSAPQDAYLDLSVSDGTQNLDQSFFVAAGTTTWVHEQYTFAADDSGPYALSFASPPLQRYMSIIDNVSIVAVPEPDMTILLEFGFIAVTVISIRRKDKRLNDGLDRQIDALVYDFYGLTHAEIKIVEGADKQGN